jgi:phosphoglycerate kinase
LESKLHIKLKIPKFIEYPTQGYLGVETSVNHMIRELKEDKIEGIYLPNTRWFKGEESGGELEDQFAHQLAGLADIFINDAFGSWQPHASTVGVTKYLPSYAGFLMQREIENLQRIYKPQKPFLAVVAGSKFNTKIQPLYKLLEVADYLVLGGVVYNAYLCAKYGFTIKGISDNDLALAEEFVEYAKDFPGKLVELPVIVESDVLEGKHTGKYRSHNINELKAGTNLNYVLDIDKSSFDIPDVKKIFQISQTILVNAVMGLTPHFNEGTIALDELIDTNSDATKLYGGGDTMQELKRLLPGLYIVALDHPKYYIFTGGGAVLKAIEQGSPKGMAQVKALIDNAK